MTIFITAQKFSKFNEKMFIECNQNDNDKNLKDATKYIVEHERWKQNKTLNFEFFA